MAFRVTFSSEYLKNVESGRARTGEAKACEGKFGVRNSLSVFLSLIVLGDYFLHRHLGKSWAQRRGHTMQDEGEGGKKGEGAGSSRGEKGRKREEKGKQGRG